MNPMNIGGKRASLLLASLLVGTGILSAADDATTTTAVPATSATATSQPQNDEIARLKAALAEQQKQIQALQQVLQNQQQLIEKAVTNNQATAQPAPPASLGKVASLTPVIPAPAPVPVAVANPKPQDSNGNGGSKNPCEGAEDTSQAPPYIRIGSTCVTPVGFMDLTPFWRSVNAGSSMGSNFAGVPYANTANGNLSEFHFSIQNSRLGFRVDGDWKGTHFIGYNEFDFNGTSGATNMAVTNGAVVPRLRLFWVDARRNKWEFLAGQSWSMMTPNRRGISALPGDLFYTQVIDINYMAGLTWTRQPGVRVIYHPSNTVALGLSVEQPDQYIGGANGSGAVTLPAALTGLATTQLDNGAGFSASPAGSYLAQPGFTPDFIAKLAFDPSSRFHAEITGIESNFHTTALAAPWVSHKANGGGVAIGLNAEIVKNLRAIANVFWSDGEGRYLFGSIPDLVVRADGSLSPVHAGSTLNGLEATIGNTLLYAYYGGIYGGRNTALDTTGKLIGYGFTGSANSQDRAIQEISFGFNQTLWKSARYGAINYMGQYEYLFRNPWYVAVGTPKVAHDNTIYMNIRYTLPGSMPNF